MTLDTDAVFIEFHRRLRAFVSRRVKSAADAEDVVQETFIRIHRSLPSLRNADRVSSWVFEIARNAIGDHYRHRLRGNAGGSQAGTAREQAAARPEIESDLEPLAACLSPMIAALPPLDRQAVEMAEVQGLSQREAAARAGVTLSGMKSRVQRARRKLEAMLRECCRIELDRRGGIVGHEPRTSACAPCRTPASAPAGSGEEQSPKGVRRLRSLGRLPLAHRPAEIAVLWPTRRARLPKATPPRPRRSRR